MRIVVRGGQKQPPDLRQLARATVTLAKDMQEAKDLGVSLDELHRARWGSKSVDI